MGFDTSDREPDFACPLTTFLLLLFVWLASLSEIKHHNQKQCIEERIYLLVWFTVQEKESIMAGSHGSWQAEEETKRAHSQT